MSADKTERFWEGIARRFAGTTDQQNRAARACARLLIGSADPQIREDAALELGEALCHETLTDHDLITAIDRNTDNMPDKSVWRTFGGKHLSGELDRYFDDYCYAYEPEVNDPATARHDIFGED